jgi:hypothetical protein
MAEGERNLKFSELLVQHIDNKLRKKFSGQLSGPDFDKQVREEVYRLVSTVFGKSSYKLSDPSLRWLSDKLSATAQKETVAGLAELAPLSVSNVRLDTLPFREVELMRNLFSEGTIGVELAVEMSRRTLS